MLQKSFIGKVLLQVMGVGAYFALVAILYWRGLTHVAGVAIIVGLLFLFKTVASSGAISIAHLFPSDPRTNVGSPALGLSKAVSFLAVGMGAVIDLGQAVGRVIPDDRVAAAIFLTLLFVCVATVACSGIRCLIGFIYGTRR